MSTTKLNKVLIIMLAFCCIACNYNTYKQGKDLFESQCAQCHMQDGSGLGELYPALTALGSEYDYSLISCYIINGKKTENSVLEMSPIKGLSDVQISNIINYINTEFNGNRTEVSINIIRDQIQKCQD